MEWSMEWRERKAAVVHALSLSHDMSRNDVPSGAGGRMRWSGLSF